MMTVKIFSMDDMEHHAEKGKGIKIENIVKTDDFEISALHLKKDTFYSIKKTDSECHFKVYTVLTGKAYLVEADAYLTCGSIVYVNELSDRINFIVLEDMALYSQSHHMSNYETFVKNIGDVGNILQQIQEKDQYTDEHCNRVYRLAVKIGIKLGYKGTRLLHLVHASRYHDIGKIYVPEAILNKPGKLDEEEMKIMQSHVLHGADLIKDYDSSLIFNIISQHHERLDGSGYPSGLKNGEILEESKIIAVCDSFDAMVTDRVYKRGKTVEEACDELKNMGGTHYDEKILTIFIEILHTESPI